MATIQDTAAPSGQEAPLASGSNGRSIPTQTPNSTSAVINQAVSHDFGGPPDKYEFGPHRPFTPNPEPPTRFNFRATTGFGQSSNRIGNVQYSWTNHEVKVDYQTKNTFALFKPTSSDNRQQKKPPTPQASQMGNISQSILIRVQREACIKGDNIHCTPSFNVEDEYPQTSHCKHSQGDEWSEFIANKQGLKYSEILTIKIENSTPPQHLQQTAVSKTTQESTSVFKTRTPEQHDSKSCSEYVESRAYLMAPEFWDEPEMPPTTELGDNEIRSLNIGENELLLFCDHIHLLGGLKVLGVSLNPSASNILEFIGKLKSLKRLHIRWGTLFTFPNEILLLSKLISLDLSNNNLIEISESLWTMTTLVKLNLSNNLIATLPPGIDTLKELQFLNLENNQLSFLPKEMTDLPKLKLISIEGNKLDPLLKDISICLSNSEFAFICEGLTSVESSHYLRWLPSQLTCLSVSRSRNIDVTFVHKFHDLRQLFLVRNGIQSISQATFSDRLTALEILNIQHNKLSTYQLPASSLPQLRHLNISHNNMKTFPGVIMEYTLLVTLSISNNKITQLPEDWEQMQQLNNLNVSGNEITSIPTSIAQLKQLAMLDIGLNKLRIIPIEFVTNSFGIHIVVNKNPLSMAVRNVIETYKTGKTVWKAPPAATMNLPNDIGFLTQLIMADFSKHNIYNITQSICNCVNIQRLSLSDNYISRLPAGFSSMTNIETLDLSKNNIGVEFGWENHIPFAKLCSLNLHDNKISHVGSGVTRWSLLTSLSMERNYLANLPDVLLSLKELKILNVRKNFISILPHSIRFATNLEKLYLGQNYFKDIPIDSIEKMPMLHTFEIFGNRISPFTECALFLEKVCNCCVWPNWQFALYQSTPEKFSLDKKSDRYVDDMTTKLDQCKSFLEISKVTLNHALVTSIPDQLLGLTHIRLLSLNHNRIEYLPTVTESWKDLEVIDLSNNHIRALPSSFSLLQSLIVVNLSHNYFEVFPDALLKNQKIRKLDLSFNNLDEIPHDISQLVLLEYLNLSFNMISCLPSSFTRLVNLSKFLLQSNRLINFSSKLLPKSGALKHLDISDNPIYCIENNVELCLGMQSTEFIHSNCRLGHLEGSYISQLTGVTRIDLSRNALRTLPDSFSLLANLQSLNLSSNKFTKIPSQLNTLTSLKEILLHENLLSDVDKQILLCFQMKSVSLVLSDMSLVALPDSLVLLGPFLINLDVSKNAISELPESITRLTVLKELNLNDNPVSTLPPTILSRLTALKITGVNVPLKFQYLSERDRNQGLGDAQALTKKQMRDKVRYASLTSFS